MRAGKEEFGKNLSLRFVYMGFCIWDLRNQSRIRMVSESSYRKIASTPRKSKVGNAIRPFVYLGMLLEIKKFSNVTYFLSTRGWKNLAVTRPINSLGAEPEQLWL